MSSSLPSFEPSRKWRIALNVGLSIVAVVLLVVLSNWMATRHYIRIKLTQDSRYALAPLTQRVLTSITNELEIVLFFDRDHPLYGSVDGLLEEYKNQRPSIGLKKIDHLRSTAQAQEVLTRFQLDEVGDPNMVLFSSGNRFKVVRQGELSDFDYDIQAMMQGTEKEVRRTAFKGESLFTAAILQVTDDRVRNAYFLQGHNEHDPTSDDAFEGYSMFARTLREKNIQIAPLTLNHTDDLIPSNCDLLIIAGPRQEFLPMELSKIENYLAMGGRLLCLFNHKSFHRSIQTGLESLLSEWGTTVRRNIVADPSQNTSNQDNAILISQFESHPIVRPLYRSRLKMFWPREIVASGKGNGVEVTILAHTSKGGHSLSGLNPNGLAAFDSALDREGTFGVMSAAEKGGLQGIASQQGATRIVVTGDSYFLSNAMLPVLGNRDFAALSVNWLLDQNDRMEISPRPIEEYRITLNRSQMNSIRWILLAGMPGSVLVLGVLVWMKRRA